MENHINAENETKQGKQSWNAKKLKGTPPLAKLQHPQGFFRCKKTHLSHLHEGQSCDKHHM
jgi:hypothetical protein